MFTINLNEIPPEGKIFTCNNHTGELNEILKDLVKKANYSVEFEIKPLPSQGAFDLSGKIKTQLKEECSRCGIDFQMPIDQKFKEILMPELETPRTGKFSKVNHYSDLTADGPDVVEYQGQQFNAGEYLHELLALSEPFNPAPPENDKGDCSVCGISVKNRSFGYNEELETKENPFKVLKGIKLN